MIGITGATGQLGQLVVQELLGHGVAAESIVAMGRNQEALDMLAAKGVVARRADYTDPASLDAAFAGVDTLLLISSSEVGQRVPQHQAAIDAAKQAGVSALAYTSLLKADTSELGLAPEHKATEAALADSDLDVTILRNGWYSENYADALPQAVAMGQLFGAAGDGKFSAATRGDYAAAAASVLANPKAHAGKTYELGGDEAFTLGDLAGYISAASGKDVAYVDMPQDAYAGALLQAGLPEPLAQLLSDTDAKAAQGALYCESGDLSALIGRKTTPMAETVKTLLG